MDDFDSDDSSSESYSLMNKPTALPPTRPWDQFREMPSADTSASAVENSLMKYGEKFLLMSAYILTFIIVLVASITARGTTFFMISQISVKDRNNLEFCNGDQSTGIFILEAQEKDLEVDFHCSGYDGSEKMQCDYMLGIERSTWLWCLFFAFATPNIGSFLRSLRIWLFKFQKMPKLTTFLFVLIMESMHVMGLSLLVFLVLPEMDTLRGMVLCSGVAVVPAILNLFTRIERNDDGMKFRWKYYLLDIPAVLAQISACLIWPMLQYVDDSTTYHPYAWAIPLGLVLYSCSFWETYVGEDFGMVWMWKMKKEMIETSRYFIYLIISPLKIGMFFGCMLLITYFNGAVTNNNDDLDFFDIIFDGFLNSFGNHTYFVREVEEESISYPSLYDGFSPKEFYELPISNDMNAVYVLIIQICCAFAAYVIAKFTSKVQIQTFSYALPVTLVMPICIVLLVFGCGGRANDSCVFIDFLPNNLFFSCPNLGDFLSYTWETDMWLFIFWFVSFLWVTQHVWFPRSPRLASTEQIFSTPWYEGLFIDQTLMLNRRKDGDLQLKTEDLPPEYDLDMDKDLKELYETYPDQDEESKMSTVRKTDKITRIYACATMWHEAPEEILEMLASLFRIDSDYSARRLSQKYLGVVDQDYYEWETHIFFDDSIKRDPAKNNELVINSYVKLLVEHINKAGTMHYGKPMRVKPCKKYPTPYGGRLIWTLPGKTRIVCHLKCNEKIRHKKRWSQCMYMYYLLGHKLMELPISTPRKAAMSENTYLLALDGDIDFQPQAIIRLVDLMKKNRQVGAACGRIHPTGSGYIPWYQKFEYAVGHWMQKATEHVLGCVLCSPGCFSLFRGAALMDDNVMRRYTKVSCEPRHYVQYDQGEDRWLCTLLLQRGWRVEYSAASDAFTGTCIIIYVISFFIGVKYSLDIFFGGEAS